MLEERTGANDNTIRYERRVLQVPRNWHRQHHGRCEARMQAYP
jgi:hypothetical protein